MIRLLLILHFLGLAMGLSVSFANMVMGGMIARAAPPEKPVLGRFPPRMSLVGYAGLALLWITGLALVYLKFGGFEALPPRFYIKLSAVILLSATVIWIYWLGRRAAKGDMAAAVRIETFGKVAALLALTAMVFAVLTFD